MIQEYISRKDMIISKSIDIICDSGIQGLNIKNVSLKTNISEDMLYKYYGSIDEILSDVIEYYFKFDDSLQATIDQKECSGVEKLRFYVDKYAQYYDGYYEISTIMLHYEELLHMEATRERVSEGILKRRQYLNKLVEQAKAEGDIAAEIDTVGITELITAKIILATLNRRIVYYRNSFRNEILTFMDALLKRIC